MSKTKTLPVFKRDIVIRLHAYEAIDLMRQLGMHKKNLQTLKKQLERTQEERGEMPMTDDELFATEEDLQFIRNFDSRLLRIYRRWQKRADKERAKRDAQDDIVF